MKKNKKIKIKGIKTVVKLEKKTDRPSFPRPAVHEKKTDYKRSREAAKIRKEIREGRSKSLKQSICETGEESRAKNREIKWGYSPRNQDFREIKT